jgi:hypothetical protein
LVGFGVDAEHIQFHSLLVRSLTSDCERADASHIGNM